MNKTMTYIAAILLTELSGFVVGMLTREGTRIYADTIRKPPLSPPGIVFPIAWTVLYALMGIGLARVLLCEGSSVRTIGIVLYVVQLVLNLAWCFIFFGAQNFGAALAELLCMVAAVIAMCVFFWKADRTAMRLQIPYLCWLCFATYLNAGVFILNR